MKKLILSTFAALLLLGAVGAKPADAACWWNGWAWQCWRPWHHAYWAYGYPYRPWGWGWGWHRHYWRHW
ncbi:MAG: hypothetical protein JO258_20195 [Alphaproteobacteria bacterium]|nr:hypothetical protein [Alphaproteobacteria bacterium]